MHVAAAAVVVLSVLVHGSRVVRREEALEPHEDASAAARIQALQPVLEKLKKVDPKAFGMLSGVLDQARGGSDDQQKMSLLEYLQDPSAAARIEALQPVLEKLKKVDPKAFGMLSGVLDQARGSDDQQKTSLLEYLQDPSAAARIEALQPVLEKLKKVDPKAFGMLSGVLDQARGGSDDQQKTSLLEYLQDPSAAARIEALQPVLDKLKKVDPKAFGMLSGVLDQARGSDDQQKTSLLQYLQDPSTAAARIEALQPVLEKLKKVDPKAFGMLSGVLHQARGSDDQQKMSLLEYQQDPSAAARIEALQPVLEKLKKVDPKAFGMLSGVLDQARARGSDDQQKMSLLEYLQDPSTAARIEALQPVLEKLKKVDPKAFGMLSGVLDQARGGSDDQQKMSLLEYLQDPGAAARIEALQPVLEKLKKVDPKAFGMLSGVLDQARGGSGQKMSLLEYLQDPQNVQGKLSALQPVLARLKGLDSKTFGLLKGMMEQVGQQHDS